MISLRNYNVGKNVNFTFSWKKFTFFFLVLSYLTYNYVSPFYKSLENIYEQDRAWNTKFNRLLARHEQLKELERTRLREKIPDRRPCKDKKNVYANLSAYSHVKKNESNNIDIYMKNYKNRYMRKKGLYKLDCYCENKLFSKFNDICDIAKKMNYHEKASKRFFFKKYGIGLILFSLLPLLGLIIPILFGGKGDALIPICGNDCSEHEESKRETEHYKKFLKASISGEALIAIDYLNIVISHIILIIFLTFIIYTLIKVIKYERLRAGKGRMSVMEYGRLCKDIFK